MQRVNYKYFLPLLVLTILCCGCNKNGTDKHDKGVQINIEDIQGYWTSSRTGIPVNIDEDFKITETGLPAPAGLRNDLQYYFNVKGGDVNCYVKCIFDAYFPEAVENPVYILLLNRDYSISVEKQYEVCTDIFEDTASYHVALDNDDSSVVLIREDQTKRGYSHISFTLNTVSESEWDSMVSGVITPADSEYNEIYEKVFNNF